MLHRWEIPVLKSRESRVLASLCLAKAVLSESSMQCCGKGAAASLLPASKTPGGALFSPHK